MLFETIRRFKGLERPVVVLCELPETGDRLDALLYTALTRATAHLVVIAPPALAGRFAHQGNPPGRGTRSDSQGGTGLREDGNWMRRIETRGGVA